MNVYAMIVLIVCASAAIPIAIFWIVQRGKLARALATANRVAASDERLVAIEARLAVLERIATDPAQQLSHAIAALEDAR